MTNEQLTAAERAALDELLPPDQQTGVLVDDLATAAREAFRRRVSNSRDGGAVIIALHREINSWRELERRTGIPDRTARRWADQPAGEERAD